MKKIYFAFILVLSCLFSAYAEESGFFVGGNLNYTSVSVEVEASYSGAWVGSGSGSNSETAYGVGFLGGYKYFFEPNRGVRAYLDYNTLRTNDSRSDYDKIGFNVDFLYNFENIWLTGLFTGFFYESVDWGFDKRIGYFGLSAGARKSFGPHGLELGFKVPFGNKVVYEESYYRSLAPGSNPNYISYYERGKGKEDYNLFFRYIFSF